MRTYEGVKEKKRRESKTIKTHLITPQIKRQGKIFEHRIDVRRETDLVPSSAMAERLFIYHG